MVIQEWKTRSASFNLDKPGISFGGHFAPCSRRCVSLLRTRCRAHAAVGDLQRAVRDGVLADKLTRRDLGSWKELSEAICDSNLVYNIALDHTGDPPTEPPPPERRSPTQLECIRRGQGAQWGLNRITEALRKENEELLRGEEQAMQRHLNERSGVRPRRPSPLEVAEHAFLEASETAEMGPTIHFRRLALAFRRRGRAWVRLGEENLARGDFMAASWADHRFGGWSTFAGTAAWGGIRLSKQSALGDATLCVGLLAGRALEDLRFQQACLDEAASRAKERLAMLRQEARVAEAEAVVRSTRLTTERSANTANGRRAGPEVMGARLGLRQSHVLFVLLLLVLSGPVPVAAVSVEWKKLRVSYRLLRAAFGFIGGGVITADRLFPQWVAVTKAIYATGNASRAYATLSGLNQGRSRGPHGARGCPERRGEGSVSSTGLLGQKGPQEKVVRLVQPTASDFFKCRVASGPALAPRSPRLGGKVHVVTAAEKAEYNRSGVERQRHINHRNQQQQSLELECQQFVPVRGARCPRELLNNAGVVPPPGQPQQGLKVSSSFRPASSGDVVAAGVMQPPPLPPPPHIPPPPSSTPPPSPVTDARRTAFSKPATKRQEETGRAGGRGGGKTAVASASTPRVSAAPAAPASASGGQADTQHLKGRGRRRRATRASAPVEVVQPLSLRTPTLSAAFLLISNRLSKSQTRPGGVVRSGPALEEGKRKGGGPRPGPSEQPQLLETQKWPRGVSASGPPGGQGRWERRPSRAGAVLAFALGAVGGRGSWVSRPATTSFLRLPSTGLLAGASGERAIPPIFRYARINGAEDPLSLTPTRRYCLDATASRCLPAPSWVHAEPMDLFILTTIRPRWVSLSSFGPSFTSDNAGEDPEKTTRM